MEIWLRGKGKDSALDFERAVSILLCMCAERSIHVGATFETSPRESRKMKYGKVKVSTDVLAFSKNSEDEIIVCQCTSEWEEYELTDFIDFRKKIVNIFETSLAWTMHKPRIHAAIFTPTESTKLLRSIESAERQGIKVITIESLLALLEGVKNDNLSIGFLKDLLSSRD